MIAVEDVYLGVIVCTNAFGTEALTILCTSISGNGIRSSVIFVRGKKVVRHFSEVQLVGGWKAGGWKRFLASG